MLICALKVINYYYYLSSKAIIYTSLKKNNKTERFRLKVIIRADVFVFSQQLFV